MSDAYEGSSSLFAIFLLAIFSLFLVPYTFIYLCSEGDASIQKIKGKSSSNASELLRRVCSKGNLTIIGLWVVWVLLLWYAQMSTVADKPFDPFEILGVEHGATDKEIKKAYRQLSLKYHPDKNPDPKAAEYFATSVAKAYQALTDEVSRGNFEKYGHPDGPQAMTIGIALPEWIFPKDKKVAPLLLLALVGVGILLPLVIVSWHMLSSNRYSGPNGIMQETLAFYMHSKLNVKESQSLVRVPETLVCAMEFITMPTPPEHAPAIDELLKRVLRILPDLKEKPAFKGKRKASVMKAHLLLLAHLERDHENVPAILDNDMKFVLQKSMPLLEEMMKIALYPRPPHGYGWMTPTLAITEMMQCITQALSLDARKVQGSKPGDSAALMLQLPHFDEDVTKKLKRKKVNNLKDLMELPDDEREEAFTSAGISGPEAFDVETFLMNLPTVHVVSAKAEVDGETDIIEQDITKFKARVLLTRPDHRTSEFKVKGKTVKALAPLYPHVKDENWFFFLVDVSTNSVLGWSKANLIEAEREALENPDVVEKVAAKAAAEIASKTKPEVKSTVINKFNGPSKRKLAIKAGDAGHEKEVDLSEVGQLVEWSFMAPLKAGKYELQLIIMSDSYVGCDRTIPVKLKVSPLTRAVAEGRDAKSMAAAKRWESDDDRSDGEKEQDDENKDSDEEEEDDGDDYDSDETGELETGDEASEAADNDDDEKAEEEGKKDK